MSNQVIDEYLSWLVPQVGCESNDRLLKQMHEKEFVFIIESDYNRIHDAIDMRAEYLRECHVKPYVDVDILGPVSVLEVMISLSRRMSFMTGEPPEKWAAMILDNLDLLNKSKTFVDAALDRLIYRTYDENGRGGFFPLSSPYRDQRRVELWYQMCSYLDELVCLHDE